MDGIKGYISIREASCRWGVSERRVNQYCAKGRIPGASRFGGEHHAKTEMEPEYHLHIRTAAGKSGAHLPLRHDYRCCRPWATERLRRLVGIWPSVPKQKRYISFASVYIPITLLFFGKAYRTLLLGQALTFCGTIPAPRSHELAGEKSCYIFVDDFHLLTDRRVSTFLCMLANRLPVNVHLI